MPPKSPAKPQAKKRAPRPKACSASLTPQTPKWSNGGHGKWNPAYDPAMCDHIVEWYEDGKLDVEIAAALKVTKQTFYEWVRTKPEFAEVVKQGKTASESWWMNIGREAAEGNRKISEKIWSIMVKNSFGFEDKIQIEDCSNGALAHSIKKLTHLADDLEEKFKRDY